MPREVAQRADLIAPLGEVFREHGYAGASLAEITLRTGLGKGSVYHFFPAGKKEMAEAVLDDVATWFEQKVFAPLRGGDNPRSGVREMFRSVHTYFRSGKRICLVGAFAIDATRDVFAGRINSYFAAWTDSLCAALRRGGYSAAESRAMAEDVVAGIQGALVLGRSRQDTDVFTRIVRRLEQRVEAGWLD